MQVAAGDARSDAVLDGVFHQGLQQEPGHHRVPRRGFDVELHGQAVGKTDQLDVEVVAQHLQLTIEADFLLAGGA